MKQSEKITYIKKALWYLRRYRGLCALIVACSLLSSVFDGFSIGTIIPLFQSVMPGTGSSAAFPMADKIMALIPGNTANERLLLLLGFVFAMVVLKNIFLYINNITINKISNWMKRDLQADLFNRVADAGLQFFAGARGGHLIGGISVYTGNVATFIFSFLQLFVTASRLLVFLGLLFFISWQLTLCVLGVGLLLLPFVRVILIHVRRLGLRTTREVSVLHVRLAEIFYSLPVVKMFGTETYEKDRFLANAGALARTQYLGAVVSNTLKPLAEVIVMAVVLGFLSVLLIIGDNTVTASLGFVAAYLYIFLRLFREVHEGIGLLSGMYAVIEPFKAYECLLTEAAAGTMPNGATPAKVLQSAIRLSNVSFAYGDRQVLTDVSLEIPKGSFVALVGATGSGKTTIAHLLAGLLHPNNGTVLVDDISTTKLDATSWRKHIGYVAQDILVFNDTIRNNIRYGSFESSDKDVEEAARVAHIHDFIQSLPEGYDTMLGDRGVKLSGGQRQRLSIARAVIRHPDLYILDEATSSLDAETEQELLERLREAAVGKTIVAIAHRLSTIANADTIVVLRDGKVVESGNHEQLLKKNGVYKYLFDIQSA